VVAVDIGEANLVASSAPVVGQMASFMILGGGLKGIRARRLIGERKTRHALRALRRIGDRESCIAEE
jgi:hypothetical protein